MLRHLVLLGFLINCIFCESEEKYGNLTAVELSKIQSIISEVEAKYLPTKDHFTYELMAHDISEYLFEQGNLNGFWEVLVFDGVAKTTALSLEIPEDKWYHYYNKPKYNMNYLIWDNKKLRAINPAYYKGPSAIVYGYALKNDDITKIQASIDYAAKLCGNSITLNTETIRKVIFDGNWEVIILETSASFGGYLSQYMTVQTGSTLHI